MARTWDDYAKERAEQLGRCLDEDAFQGVLSEIAADLRGWGSDDQTREAFWQKLSAHYENAPKPMLKEATAAAKLLALKAKADAYIARARRQP